MLCDRCEQNPATVYFTKVINGKKTEIHLCSQCAADTEQLYFDSELSFQNLLSGLLDMTAKHPEQFKQVSSDLTCPTCKMTYHHFRRIGKFGCSDCYKTFGIYLPPILKRIHGNHLHTGKIPKKTKGELIIKRKIEGLRQQLNAAIREEEYEEAAKLRDKIRNLEKGDAS